MERLASDCSLVIVTNLHDVVKSSISHILLGKVVLKLLVFFIINTSMSYGHCHWINKRHLVFRNMMQ